jgi:hypothetical protein
LAELQLRVEPIGDGRQLVFCTLVLAPLTLRRKTAAKVLRQSSGKGVDLFSAEPVLKHDHPPAIAAKFQPGRYALTWPFRRREDASTSETSVTLQVDSAGRKWPARRIGSTEYALRWHAGGTGTALGIPCNRRRGREYGTLMLVLPASFLLHGLSRAHEVPNGS